MEPIRCFIAVELPEELRDKLDNLQAQLKSGDQPGVKWVNPYGIHLTLKFLGSVAQDRISPITRAMTEVAKRASPFTLQVGGLGVFPNVRRVQVAWVGLGGEVDKLAQLQQGVESALAGLGFAPERRSFTPHLTLARLRDRASPEERQRLGQLIAETRFEPDYSFLVDAISLIRSQLTREGAIYSQISSVELGKPLPTTTA
jgi:2'-5' RNA ligase